MDEINQLGEMLVKASLECMGQLTHFVYRGEIKAKDAAKLAWDLGGAFAAEAVKRIEDAKK